MDYLTKEELYRLLDIEHPSEFEYFEDLAALLECEAELEENVLFELVSGMDRNNLAVLISNYFEEVTDYLPGDAAELYGILEKIKFALMGMARSCTGDEGELTDENVLINLVDELDRFRKWYSAESKVYCTSFGSGEEEILSLRHALVMSRTEQILGEKNEYDFYDCMEYPLEEYVVAFGDLVQAAMEDDENNDEDMDGLAGTLMM